MYARMGMGRRAVRHGCMQLVVFRGSRRAGRHGCMQLCSEAADGVKILPEAADGERKQHHHVQSGGVVFLTSSDQRFFLSRFFL